MVQRNGIEELLFVMSRLRDPKTGCPWDKNQTFESIAPYTIEEAYEVMDAIKKNDKQQLQEELGDLLFQIVFYAQLSSEAGDYNFDAIARRIAEKMRDRHPHVFKQNFSATVDDCKANWESKKALERENLALKKDKPVSALDGIARALPALMRAEKLQKRAALKGFDWKDINPVLEKIREELNELEDEISNEPHINRIKEETGDVIFSCVNLARHLGIDAEDALRDANDKFDRRFRLLETYVKKDKESIDSLSIGQMEEYWNIAKESKKEA